MIDDRKSVYLLLLLSAARLQLTVVGAGCPKNSRDLLIPWTPNK